MKFKTNIDVHSTILVVLFVVGILLIAFTSNWTTALGVAIATLSASVHIEEKQ